jgi:hypothetical protein
MQLMIEPRQACRHGRADVRVLVTFQADTLRGKQAIVQAGTGERRRMTESAIQLRGQVDAVRKRLRRLGQSRTRHGYRKK